MLSEIKSAWSSPPSSWWQSSKWGEWFTCSSLWRCEMELLNMQRVKLAHERYECCWLCCTKASQEERGHSQAELKYTMECITKHNSSWCSATAWTILPVSRTMNYILIVDSLQTWCGREERKSAEKLNDATAAIRRRQRFPEQRTFRTYCDLHLLPSSSLALRKFLLFLRTGNS